MPADLTPRYQGLDLRARRGGGAPAEEEEAAASTEGGRYGNEGGPEGAPTFLLILCIAPFSLFFHLFRFFSGKLLKRFSRATAAHFSSV